MSIRATERLLLTLIVLLLPVYRMVSVKVGPISLSVVDAMIVLGSVLVFFSLGRRLVMPHIPVSAWLGIFFVLAGAFCSLCTSYNTASSSHYVFSLLLMIMLAWLVIDSLRSIENVKRLANVFVIGTSLLAFTAIGQQLNNIFAERSLQSVSGTFDARNEMIFYLVPGFLIITSLARSANSQLAKLIFSVGVIVHYAAIFFSRGRAGMLIVTTCFLILLIITARKPKRALAWLCAACAFVVLSANIIVLPGKNSNLYMNKLVHRYSGSLFQEVEANRGSAAVRIDILKGLVDAWKSEPLSGIGIGTFKNRSHEFVKSKLVNNGIQPHNSYLGMLAEAGPFGLGGVLLLVSSGSLVLRRREGLTEHVRWLQSGIGVAFLGVAFNLLIFDGFLRYGFWLMIGLTLSLRRVLNDRSNGRGVTRVICDGIRF